MTSFMQAGASSIQLAVAWVTLAGVCGALGGVALTSRGTLFPKLVPFSSGLLLGMALFLLLPEALPNGGLMQVLGLCTAGCFVFGMIEATLHKVHASPHSRVFGLIPLILAVSLHSALDGWNIAIALGLPSARLIWAFLIGMSLHKLTGGVAIGAIFRTAAPSRGQAFMWAGLCESFTAGGAILQLSSSRSLGTQWTVSLICLTAGSFLYLGYHSFQTARARAGFRSAAFPAMLGMASIWMVSMLR